MGMNGFLGWSLIGVGGLVLADVVQGRSPLADAKAVLGGQPRPAAHSSSVVFGGGSGSADALGGSSSTPVPGGPTTTGDIQHGAPGAASGAHNAGTTFGMQQLGKPYLWGGTGPDRWDCSGLTRAMAAHAGVVIPRTTGPQSQMGRSVPMSDVREGDLVFWGHPADHVGWAINGTTMIVAPHTGDVVKYQTIYTTNVGPYARRIL